MWRRNIQAREESIPSEAEQKTIRHRAIVSANKGAKELSLPHTLTLEQWEHALDYFDNRCAVCRRDTTGILTARISVDHWIPLSYEGDDNPGSVAHNIVPLCLNRRGCNNRKRNKLPTVWLQRAFGKRRAKLIAARIQEYFDSLK